jgi:sec-independent protein translocase protein TatA
MGNIGLSELIVILMILTLVFGASRLPKIGESLGKAARMVKRGMAENEDIAVSSKPKKPISAGNESTKLDANVSDAEILEEQKRKS